jgi:5-methyltetrahydrofolate--homocysteine methyltransferase
LRIGEWVEKEGRLPLPGSVTFGVPVSEQERPLGKPEAEDAIGAIDETFQDVQQDVLNGRDNAIIDHIKPLLDKDIDAQDIIQKGMVSAMMLISEDFKKGTVFIPEVLLSARTMNTALEYLEPHLAAWPQATSGTILLGTVHGDMHDIGKNMVAAMLRGVGLQVIDIGVNVPTDIFVNKVKDTSPDILGLSALLTTTMPQMKDIIDALTEEGIREYVKVMVGGAPVNRHFADEIGADGYGKDAGEAVSVAQKLLREK